MEQDAEVKLPVAITKQDAALVKDILKKNKIDEIEDATQQYVKDVFDSVRKRNDFVQKLEDKLLDRIDELTTQQLTYVLGNSQVNANDAFNKALAPTASIISERQRSETAKETAKIQAESRTDSPQTETQMKQLQQNVPQDVLIGLQQIQNLLQVMGKQPVPIEPAPAGVDEKKE